MHQRMANALSYGEFRIFYQPVVDLQTGIVVGLEALCRWPQRDDTFTAPETFISQAESSGFIVQLGDWVLRTAVEQVRRWQQRFGLELMLAVNLSGRQFLHYNLIKSIEDALRVGCLLKQLDPRQHLIRSGKQPGELQQLRQVVPDGAPDERLLHVVEVMAVEVADPE